MLPASRSVGRSTFSKIIFRSKLKLRAPLELERHFAVITRAKRKRKVTQTARYFHTNSFRVSASKITSRSKFGRFSLQVLKSNLNCYANRSRMRPQRNVLESAFFLLAHTLRSPISIRIELRIGTARDNKRCRSRSVKAG